MKIFFYSLLHIVLVHFSCDLDFIIINFMTADELIPS